MTAIFIVDLPCCGMAVLAVTRALSRGHGCGGVAIPRIAVAIMTPRAEYARLAIRAKGRHVGFVKGGTDAKSICAGCNPVLEIVRAGAANRIDLRALRQNRTHGRQASGARHRAGKQFQPIRTCIKRCEGLGWAKHTRPTVYSAHLGVADHLRVAVGGNDQLATGLCHAVHLRDLQHRARTDQRVITKGAGQHFDALQRVGGIERHFEGGKTRLYQGGTDGRGLCVGQPAQDGDQGRVM